MTMLRRPEGGYTFVELLVVVTILLILASALFRSRTAGKSHMLFHP